MSVVLHQLKVVESVMTSTLSGWRGTRTRQTGRQPAKMLQLYDMEACPYCRSVREVLTALHLDAEIRPCPKGGSRFRGEAERLAGKQQFPLLVDPNTQTVLLESEDIIRYLFKTYGEGQVPGAYLRRPWQIPLGMVASGVSAGRGHKVCASRAPSLPLALWSFESSPYSRLVRERLCELEVPYVLHNLGKEQFADLGSAKMRVKPGPYKPVRGGKREAFLKRLGRVQVPYLEDPNTGVSMFESADILAYLNKQYAR